MGVDGGLGKGMGKYDIYSASRTLMSCRVCRRKARFLEVWNTYLIPVRKSKLHNLGRPVLLSKFGGDNGEASRPGGLGILAALFGLFGRGLSRPEPIVRSFFIERATENWVLETDD